MCRDSSYKAHKPRCFWCLEWRAQFLGIGIPTSQSSSIPPTSQWNFLLNLFLHSWTMQKNQACLPFQHSSVCYSLMVFPVGDRKDQHNRHLSSPRSLPPPLTRTPRCHCLQDVHTLGLPNAVYWRHYITHPNKALWRGNPSNLPCICLFDFPKMSNLMMPGVATLATIIMKL